MKRFLILAICAVFVFAALSLSSCSCSGSSGGSGKTVISQVDPNEAKDLVPAKAIIHGRTSGNSAPNGWEVKSGEGGDYITYIQKTSENTDECPYIQFGCDDMAAEDLFNSVITLKETKGVGYSTDNVEINGTQFLGVFGDDGENSLFGTVNGLTMVINYKGVDPDDATVKDIISGIEIK